MVLRCLWVPNDDSYLKLNSIFSAKNSSLNFLCNQYRKRKKDQKMYIINKPSFSFLWVFLNRKYSAYWNIFSLKLMCLKYIFSRTQKNTIIFSTWNLLLIYWNEIVLNMDSKSLNIIKLNRYQLWKPPKFHS